MEAYSDASATGYGGFIREVTMVTKKDSESALWGDESMNENLYNLANYDMEVAFDKNLGLLFNSEQFSSQADRPLSSHLTGETQCQLTRGEKVEDQLIISAQSQLTRGGESEKKLVEKGSNESLALPEKRDGNIPEDEVCGNWSFGEAAKSSTWRELEAMKRIFFSKEVFFKNKIIRWHTDCKNLVHILRKGSQIEDINKNVELIGLKCISLNCRILVIWIPRCENIRADSLSRCFDSNDWSIKDEFF